MYLFQKIDTVNNINSQEFTKNYFKTQKPLIVKGLSEATAAGKIWSINYFKETMGEAVVDIYDSSKKNHESAFLAADLKMKFGDYLNIISNDEPTTLRIFLYNLFKHNPKLRNEFPCPLIFKGILDKVGRMFFGGKDTKVRVHYDIDMSNVLHTHFGGRKRVILIAPEYSELLYRLPLNTYSLVDLDKPDYKKYPGLRLVKGYDFVLESGDTLFMPSGYWHYMTYLETGFSVSYRKLAPTFQTKLNGILNLCVYLPLDKLMNRIIGSRWLEIKKQVAEKRANTAIEHIYEEDNDSAIRYEEESSWFI